MTIQRYEIFAACDQRAGCHPEICPHEDDKGEWVKFEDIPKPEPWVSKPDKPGWWKHSVKGKPMFCHELVWRTNYRRNDADQIEEYERLERIYAGSMTWPFTANLEYDTEVGLWQFIPDEQPPL